MRRRSVLKGIVASTLQTFFPPHWLIQAVVARGLTRRVRPTDPQWPRANEWAKLKAAVGGNLLQPQPLFAACQKDATGAACDDVLLNIRNPFYIGDQPAGTEVSGWLDAWTPAPSAYAIAARDANDVAAGIRFAVNHNLRLVVKGGGHSYLGTSNAPDSLLIWTRKMNKVTLHDAFVGHDCEGRVAPVHAVTAEAGAMWIDLYHAVTTEAGRYVQGGGCTTVGVAGLVQSGGFGSFSKGFGTAAAGLLEAEVVTANGKVRIANACCNQDLFWALKGGGGGSFGLVTKVTLLTHPLPEFFGFAGGAIGAQSDSAFRELVQRFFEFYRDKLFNPHWGESIKIRPDNVLELSMVCQGLNDSEVKRVWQPFFDWVKSVPELTMKDVSVGARPARSWWDVVARKKRGSTAMISDSRPGAPVTHAYWEGDQGQVGAFIHGYDSVWLPAKLLHGDEQQRRLVNALFAASRSKRVELHFNKGIAGAPAEAIARTRDTATNPAVVDAFALVIIADGERPSYPGQARPAMDAIAARRNKHQIDLAIAELRKLVPDAGSYVSESNYFNASWQKAYWGGNYSRLRAIKERYDPDGLFFVHHGVGSEDWSNDGFTRLKRR